MRRLILALAFLLMGLQMALAKDCGNGLPCGPLKWSLPLFPVLPSPTRIPTMVITAVSTGAPTATPVATATPAPTGTIQADFTDLGNQLRTLQAVVNATPIPVEVNGTPVDPGQQLENITADTGTFFGYLRGFSEVNLGGLTPFIGLLLLGGVLMFSLKAVGFILPVAAVLFRLILRIVEVVKQLIGL